MHQSKQIEFENDPVETIPDPESLKTMIAESIRRTVLLRSLLRTSRRAANYPAPTSQAIPSGEQQ